MACLDDVGVEADDDDDSEWPLFTAAAVTPDTEAADDWLAFGSMLPKLTDSKSYKHGYGNLNSHPRL